MKVVFSFHILKTMLIYKNQWLCTLQQWNPGFFAPMQRHLCASTALMFVDGMKHRTQGSMESKLLRSTHRTSPRAVKHGETLWYPSQSSHRGTATFLHHLVTFSCNCKPQSTSWAVPGTVLKAKAKSLLLGTNYCKTSWEVNCQETVPLSVLRHITNCCSLCWSDDWEYCLAVGLACITDSSTSQVPLPLLLSCTSSLSPCWDRNHRNVHSDEKGGPVVALQVQLRWAYHVSQVTADTQSTTTNLWGTSHGWNHHYTSLTTANKYSCLAFMKIKSQLLYLAGQQYHHLLQNRKYNPRWQHFGNDKLSLLGSQFQGSNENTLKTI